MVANILEQSGLWAIWENLATTENVTFNANLNACGWGVLFNISDRSCGYMWKVTWLFGAVSKILSVRIKRKLVMALIVQYTFHFLWKFQVYNFFYLSINRTKSTNWHQNFWKSQLEFVLISPHSPTPHPTAPQIIKSWHNHNRYFWESERSS